MKTFFIGAFLALSVLLGACNLQPVTPVAEPIEAQANFWRPLAVSAGFGFWSDVATNSLGTPAIAYWDQTTNLVVKQLNASNTWITLGNPLTSSAGAGGRPSLVFDKSNRPVIAFSGWVNNVFNLYVNRWNGSSWVGFDLANTPLRINNIGYSPSLALDTSGNPVVAWKEYDTVTQNETIYVKHWNGSAWVSYETISTPLNINRVRNAVSPTIALDNSNRPVVAWIEAANTTNTIYNLYIKHWNGSAWVQYGSGGKINGVSSANSPSLAVDPTGKPIVTWAEDGKIYVKMFNSTWAFVGTNPLNLNLTRAASDPTLVLESNGNPVVAWSELSSGAIALPLINVKRWDGTNWVLRGTAIGRGDSLSVALDKLENPIVSWDNTSNGVSAALYITNGWQPLGDTLDINPLNDAKFSSIARKSDNRPIVAWTEQITTSNSNVYVKERVGNTWQSLGAVDKVAGNLTTSASIAVRSDNRPVVAFTESSNSNSIIDVFVRRWNGASWLNVGGALSNNHLDVKPKLVLNNTNIPFVAWISCPSSGCGLYVKKFNGTSWVGLDGSAAPLPLATALSASATVEIVLDSLGNPVVGWTEATATGYTLRLKKWTGTSWQSLNSIYLGFSPNVSLAIDSTNKPFVATAKDNILGVFYLDGTWKRLGTTLGANNPENLVLQIGSDNHPVILWKYTTSGPFFFSGINVQRWNGSTWVTVGTSAITGFGEFPLRLDMVLKSNNNPIVSFDMQLQSTNKQDVYVKQY